MSTFHNLRRAENELPEAFARLLQSVSVGDCALWFPRSCLDGGGNIGDFGVVNRGRFNRTGNVYSRENIYQPEHRQGLHLDSRKVSVTDSVDRVFQSSSVDVTAIGLRVCDHLPPGIAPVNLNIQLVRNKTDTQCACMILGGDSVLVESVSWDEQLRPYHYMAHHYNDLSAVNGPKVVMLIRTSKASGWLSGFASASAKSTTVEAPLTVPGIAALRFGWANSSSSSGYSGTSTPVRSSGLSVSSQAPIFLPPSQDIILPERTTCGPQGWTATAPRDYTVMIGYIKARKRDRFRGAMIKTWNMISFAKHRRVGHQGTNTQHNAAAGASEPSASDGSHDPVPDAPGDELPVDKFLDAALDRYDYVDIMIGASDLMSKSQEYFGCTPSASEVEFLIQTDVLPNGETFAYVHRIYPLSPVNRDIPQLTVEELALVKSTGLPGEFYNRSVARTHRKKKTWNKSALVPLRVNPDITNKVYVFEGSLDTDSGGELLACPIGTSQESDMPPLTLRRLGKHTCSSAGKPIADWATALRHDNLVPIFGYVIHQRHLPWSDALCACAQNYPRAQL